MKADRSDLANEYQLSARYFFPFSKTVMDLTADLRACRTTVSLEVATPDGKGAKANATWLAKSLAEVSEDLSLVFNWPGRNNDIRLSLKEFLAEPSLASDGQKAAPKKTHLVMSVHGVRRFKSRKLFIEDVEATALGMVELGKSTGLLTD